MSVTIKEEGQTSQFADPSVITSRLEQLSTKYPSGFNQDHLKSEMSEFSLKEILPIISRLTNEKQMQMEHKNGKLFWKWNSAQQAKFLKEGTSIAIAIYESIRNAGLNGMTVGEIGKKVPGETMKHIGEVLKSLVAEKRVRQVTGKQQNRKRLFILYELEYAESKVGEDLYDELGNLNEEKSSSITYNIVMCLRNKLAQAEKAYSDPKQAYLRYESSFVTVKEVRDYLQSVNMPSVKDESLCLLLDGLVLQCVADRLVQSVSSNSAVAEAFDITDFPDDTFPGEPPSKKAHRQTTASSYKYRFVMKHSDASGLSLIPCSLCPVALDCVPGGKVCPEKCRYLKQWLKF